MYNVEQHERNSSERIKCLGQEIIVKRVHTHGGILLDDDYDPRVRSKSWTPCN